MFEQVSTDHSITMHGCNDVINPHGRLTAHIHGCAAGAQASALPWRQGLKKITRVGDVGRPKVHTITKAL